MPKKLKDTTEQKTYFLYGYELKSNEGGTVTGYIATGDLDLVNDIVTPECMMDMLAQMKDRVIKVDVEHEALRGKSNLEKEINKTTIPIAKITNAGLEAKGLKVVTVLNTHHSRYDEVKGSIDDGFLDRFSIAYIPTQISKEFKNGKEIRRLEKVTLLNVAFTGNAINPGAEFTEVMLKSIEEFGGLDMTEKNKPEVKDGKNGNGEGNGDATPPESTESEVKALRKELKAHRSEMAEVKALLEKKAEKKEKGDKNNTDNEDEDDGSNDTEKKAEERLKNLEAKAVEFDKFLNKPQIKGMTNEQDPTNTPEVKSGEEPIDYIF